MLSKREDNRRKRRLRTSVAIMMVNSELKKICTRPATEPITAQAENDGATTSTTLSSCSDTSDLISDIDETDSAQPSPCLALQ